MAYSDFCLESIVNQFQIKAVDVQLFEAIVTIEPSDWLQETLSLGQNTVVASGTEKAQSEFVIAPILVELSRRNLGRFGVYSGKVLDMNVSLNGECDFVLARGQMSRILQAPILSLIDVQEKVLNLGQCVAQMIGVWLFNHRKGESISSIYGCVTTGDRWQFLKLEGLDLLIDRRIYNHPTDLASILGIFQLILDQP